jgi:hypothetical protein
MRAVGVSVVTLLVLRAVGASAAAPARPPDVPIFFDARDHATKPIVHVRMFGQTLKMLLDTGAYQSVLGPRAARVDPAVVKAGHVESTDYSGRPIVGIRVPVFDVRLPTGWPSLGDTFLVSDWIDRMNRDLFIDPGAPHFDGVIAPITLAAKDRVVVIDFGERTLSVGSWADAQTRLAAANRALTPAFAPINGSGELVVPVVVQGRAVPLMLDSGASSSALYIPHDVDLIGMLSRSGVLPATIEVGEVSSKVRLDLVEKVEPLLGGDTPSPYDGLLGMDVLLSCILAFDDKRFLVRCHSDEPPPTSFDLGAMRCPTPRRSLPVVQVGSEGLAMRQHPDGSYEWNGRHVAARIHKDGRVTYSKRPLRAGTPYDRMDPEEERRWFEEQAGGLLTALARANERQTILDALDALPSYLARILDDGRLSLAQRRHILFLLWDEMAESDDRERGWAGAQAREIIDRFIQERLPSGTADGYSAAELQASNRTRAKGIRFEPYQPLDRKPQSDPLGNR